MISSNELTEDSKSKEQAPVYLIDEEAADQLIEHIYELLVSCQRIFAARRVKFPSDTGL
jgi:hypothetical protein